MRTQQAWAAALLAAAAAGEPLLLTPLLQAGKQQEARERSAVTVAGQAMGHAGFFSTPSASGKNVNNFFFWFQPCLEGCDAATAPLIQWFQGGPGAPSTFGALGEIGNWYVGPSEEAHERCFSWCRKANCLFVDSPAMTGFTYQVNASGDFDRGHVEYTRTSQEATAQVYEVLAQFLKVWPEYQPAPYYVTGESYGGRYTPWMAKTVWERNLRPTPTSVKVNLRGLSVGDPVMDWGYQMPTYPATLYGMGVIMEHEREELAAIFANATRFLGKDCRAAFREWNRVWNDDGGSSCKPRCEFLFERMTGSSLTENVLLGAEPAEMNYFAGFLTANSEAFHFAGSPASQFDEGGEVYSTMVESGDFCEASAPLFAELYLEAGIDVNIYSSTADPLLGPPTTEAGVRAVWDFAAAHHREGPAAKAAFYAANKTVWRVERADKEPAGYARCTSFRGRRFCYTVVRNAGHTTPTFIPRAAYDMNERVLQGRPFNDSGCADSVPTCAACGGAPPFAGSALPACHRDDRGAVGVVI